MKHRHCLVVVLGMAVLAALGTVPARAEVVRNLNEVALNFSTNKTAAGKPDIQKSAAGKYHTFRYLKVTEIQRNVPESNAVTLIAVEPSSDLKIKLVIPKDKEQSLKVVETLAVEEAIHGKGRIKSMGVDAPNLIVLDSVLIDGKDRAAPKLSKELLREIDTTAH